MKFNFIILLYFLDKNKHFLYLVYGCICLLFPYLSANSNSNTKLDSNSNLTDYTTPLDSLYCLILFKRAGGKRAQIHPFPCTKIVSYPTWTTRTCSPYISLKQLDVSIKSSNKAMQFSKQGIEIALYRNCAAMVRTQTLANSHWLKFQIDYTHIRRGNGPSGIQ